MTGRMRVPGAAHGRELQNDNPQFRSRLHLALQRLRKVCGMSSFYPVLTTDIREVLAAYDRQEAALREVYELISGYVDIRDGANGPLPNKAMLAQQAIDEVLGISGDTP